MVKKEHWGFPLPIGQGRVGETWMHACAWLFSCGRRRTWYSGIHAHPSTIVYSAFIIGFSCWQEDSGLTKLFILFWKIPEDMCTFLRHFSKYWPIIFARSRRFILRTGRSGGRLQSSSGGVRSLLLVGAVIIGPLTRKWEFGMSFKS